MSENTINIYMNADDKVSVKDNTQIIKLQGPKGEPGPKGEDGVQGILLEFITAQANGLNFVKEDDVYEPFIRVSEGMVQITYLTSLPFQINDGEVQYMEAQNVERPLPSTTEPITIKFYNARMKLMLTKTVEVQ